MHTSAPHYCATRATLLCLKAPTTRRYTLSRSAARSWVCRAEGSNGPVIVVGGGAAGLTAAYFAAKAGAEVLILEKMPEAGKKILISGGKRCNVLPMDVELERDYFSESSKSALRAIFSQWTLAGCKDWLEDELGLPLAFEEGSSKYFPASNSAQEVRDCLVSACLGLGAQIRYNAELTSLAWNESHWTCRLADNTSLQTRKIIMASGGMSFPVMGTDGRGMRLLEGFGHTLCKPYPALTPLRGDHVASKQLAGLSIYNAKAWCEENQTGKKAKRRQMARAERSAMLFTHRGYSGPAILDLSHHLIKAWDRKQDAPGLRISWSDEEASVWEERLNAPGSKSCLSILKQTGLPSRLAEALLQEASAGTSLTDRKIATLTKKEKAALLQNLVGYTLPCTGHEGYAKAEVTGGGVQLNDINCSTMESRITPGLFLCGEVLDVFGRIGGFNFYWAWLTGRLAGQGVART